MPLLWEVIVILDYLTTILDCVPVVSTLLTGVAIGDSGRRGRNDMSARNEGKNPVENQSHDFEDKQPKL